MPSPPGSTTGSRRPDLRTTGPCGYLCWPRSHRPFCLQRILFPNETVASPSGHRDSGPNRGQPRRCAGRCLPVLVRLSYRVRSACELAGAACAFVSGEGRRDPGVAPRGRRASPHSPCAAIGLGGPGGARRADPAGARGPAAARPSAVARANWLPWRIVLPGFNRKAFRYICGLRWYRGCRVTSGPQM